MGRRKIEIEFIREDRSRATTFIKRKSGLFKKAHELAILTGAQVAVVVFSQQDRLFTYSNEPCSNICSKFLQTPDAYETKGPNDFSIAQEHDDESEDDAPSQGPGRKNSLSVPPRKVSSAGLSGQASPPPHSQSDSRKNSVQLSPSLPSPKRLTPMQRQGEFVRASSPPSIGRKRGRSPGIDRGPGSPKLIKHEPFSRAVSDVRSSPGHPPRMQHGAQAVATDSPDSHSHDVPRLAAPSLNYPPIPQLQGLPPAFADHPQSQHSQQRPSYAVQASSHSPSHMQMHSLPHPCHQSFQQQHAQEPHPQQHRHMHAPPLPPPPPGYNPSYNTTPSGSSRQLPMAPPLTIPSNGSGPQATETTNHAASHGDQQAQDQKPGQPLLLVGSTYSGPSRVLLPGESSGQNSTESPSNFASSLYSSSNISGIGTNVPIPRISTDVGSLFYNWNTNEPGLSPATSLTLGQYREGRPDSANGGGTGSNPSGSSSAKSQLSGPPISAGVLENFSPTTAQWLSGHANLPSKIDGGKPY